MTFNPDKLAREWLETHITTLSGRPGFDGELAFGLSALLRRVRLDTLEETAEVADNESELPGDPPAEIVADFKNEFRAAEHLRAAVRATKKSISAAIRAAKEKP